MKAIHLTTMLSLLLSAGIMHASDNNNNESLLEQAAYGASLAGAPAAASFGQWLSSFQRPSLPSAEGLRNSRLANVISSGWSNVARPVIEGAGSASRYLVPTSLSQYAQTFPTVQQLTRSYPRGTQNFAIGSVALPLATLAAYKLVPQAYSGAKNLYQRWNPAPAQTVPTVDDQIRELATLIGYDVLNMAENRKEKTYLEQQSQGEGLSEQDKLNIANQIEKLDREHTTLLGAIEAKSVKVDKLLNKEAPQQNPATPQPQQQSSWFSSWKRPSLSLPSSISWQPSWPSFLRRSSSSQ